MYLREGNIIVCDCGAERNPEIQFDHDFVKYDAEKKIATCSNCGASGEIIFLTDESLVPLSESES